MDANNWTGVGASNGEATEAGLAIWQKFCFFTLVDYFVDWTSSSFEALTVVAERRFGIGFYLKQFLIGTAPGRFLLTCRNYFEALYLVLFRVEQGVGAIQDICAQKLISRICAPNKTFIDVGAHIGSIVSEVIANSDKVKVIAIEADPVKAKSLQKKFTNVIVHSCALGAERAVVSFFIDKKRPGYSTLLRESEDSSYREEIKVDLRQLDELVESELDVDVIKIDVEGAELGVLQGSTKVISRCRPLIYFECAGDDTTNASTGSVALYNWFHDNNYDVFVPNRVAHDAPPLSLESFGESTFYPRRTLNFFAVPEEKRVIYRDRARRIMGVT